MDALSDYNLRAFLGKEQGDAAADSLGGGGMTCKFQTPTMASSRKPPARVSLRRT